MNTLGSIRLQYSGVFDLKSRPEVINSLLSFEPNYIVNAMFGAIEGQVFCDVSNSFVLLSSLNLSV